MAISGAGAGKTGKVLQVLEEKGRAIVEGLNIVTKATRKTKDNPQGGLIKKEASIHMAKLMLHCPSCKKGVRIRKAIEGDKKVRKCKECGHTF